MAPLRWVSRPIKIGVTAGAIYRHFESMEAIVDAVVERMGTILFEGFPPEAPDPI